MTLKTEKFVRKARPVDVVKVTEDNLSEVAGWCQGLVVPINGLGGNNTQPYVHVAVRNPRTDKDNQAYPGMVVIREDFRNYRVITNKQFKNSYDPVAKPKPVAPSPASMPVKKTEPKDPSGLTEPTPEAVDVSGGAVEVEVNRDAGTGQFVSDEYTEANPDTTVTETIEKEDNVDGGNSFNHDELSSEDKESISADETQKHEDRLEDVVPGDMIDPEQPEEDEDGTVQLGVPLDTEPEIHPEAPETVPELCGQCGSQVDELGLCSKDGEHNVNGTAEDVATPRIVPGD